MVKRAAVVGAAALAVGAGVVLITRAPSRPPPLDISYADIAKVQAYPVPEGTPPPPLLGSGEARTRTHGRPLIEVRSDIPLPFPAPVRCDYSGFGDGLQLSVWLSDGRRLDYFACAFPEELKSLYEHAWPS